MGVSASTELPSHFDGIRSWPWSRITSVLKTYSEGEYDFGIDDNVVVVITGCSGEEARELILAHSRNDSGIINAITLLISLIVLAESSKRNENVRLAAVFELVDFSKVNAISFDELCILLICVGQSFNFILGRQGAYGDIQGTKWATAIYEKLGKKTSSSISKEEITTWATQQLWKNSIFSVNAILDILNMDPADLVAAEDVEAV